jgi:hypothetical protein
MYSNRDVLEQAIHKAFNEYGYMKDEKAHEQFLPLQDAFKCCGPTEETKATFVAEGICTEPEYV